MTSETELLNRLLSSDAKAELLVLFHKNPWLVDTVEGVARRIGKSASAVETDVKDLLDLGILKLKRIGKSEVISLDSAKDKEIQETVAKHLWSLKRS